MQPYTLSYIHLLESLYWSHLWDDHAVCASGGVGPDGPTRGQQVEHVVGGVQGVTCDCFQVSRGKPMIFLGQFSVVCTKHQGSRRAAVEGQRQLLGYPFSRHGVSAASAGPGGQRYWLGGLGYSHRCIGHTVGAESVVLWGNLWSRSRWQGGVEVV